MSVDSIRRLRPEDTTALISLRREALDNAPLAFGASTTDDRGLSVEFVRTALADEDEQAVFGHFDGSHLTGMVGVLRAAAVKRRHTAHIWGMYVAPPARAQGVGRRLLDAAIAHARAWPTVERLHLSVSDSAAAARQLYETAGFQLWGRESRALQWAGRFVDEFHLVLDLDRLRSASPNQDERAGGGRHTLPASTLNDDVVRLLPARRGHFLLESGHHGDLWLDLELLCLRPEPIRRLAAQIATALAAHQIEEICGPLVEGAFVAMMVATVLDLPFTYAERFAPGKTATVFPVEYRIPRALRREIRGKRVAIVDDVINAGSAVRATFTDLKACGAEPVAIGAIAVLGHAAARFAAEKKLALETVASFPNEIWIPSECPLCACGVPLTDLRD